MNTTGKFVLGVLGAAAAGAVVGMLIAPAKGTDTRKKMIEGIGKFAIDLANMMQAGRLELNEVSDTLSDEAEGLKSDAKEHLRNVEESLM
jgi:gas vesicle protein